MDLPVLDLSQVVTEMGSEVTVAQAATELDAAFRETGFVLIVGHAIDDRLISEMYRVTKAFFSLPMDQKRRSAATPESRFQGYCSVEGGAHGGTITELWESYEINKFDSPDDAVRAGYATSYLGAFKPNMWPEEPRDLERVWRSYFAAMERLAMTLTVLAAVALDLPADYFRHFFDKHGSYLAANHYPSQEHSPEPGQLRQAEHTDFGALVILYQDGAPGGLEVKTRSGQWVPVRAREGSLVVDLGDLFERWTNSHWRATPHRVVNPPTKQQQTERVSIPFFWYPNHDAVINCLPTCHERGAAASAPSPVTVWDWAKQRMERSSSLVE